MKVTATFHPQAWQNDYAIPVDPEGPTTFDVTPEIEALLRAGKSFPQNDSWESDELRNALAAPAWIREWSGPFYIELKTD